MTAGSTKRTLVLAGARDSFLARGFDGASMDDIAAAAGVSKQTVYAHFGSKADLFLAFAEDLIGARVRAQAVAAPLPAPEGDPGPVLLGHAREQLSTATSRDLMRLRRLAIAEAERFPDFGRRVFEAGAGSSISRLEAALTAWHHAGRLHVADPARSAALFNWMLMGGPTSEAMLLGRTSVDDAAGLEAHAAECVRVFLSAHRS